MTSQKLVDYSHHFIWCVIVLVAIFSFSILNGPALAENLTLVWDANSEPDLTGYLVFCGESSGSYNPELTKKVSSDTTTCEFTDLEEGTTYYFAAKAISQTGESAYSPEISYTVPAAPIDSQDIDNDGFTDSDGDGFSNSDEIAAGFDPNDPNSNPAFYPAWNSTSDYSAVSALGSGNTGIVEANFDVTPLADWMNGGIGYADSSVRIDTYRDMAMFVRMNRYGRFDVRNGWHYDADVDMHYTANKSYHVRVVADLDAETYTVWVTPPGGTETRIANDYAFRADAPPTDDLGKVCLIDYSGEFRVENHTLAQAAEDGNLNGAFEIEEMITEVRVAASSDDAEENGYGSVSTSSSDLELTYSRSNQTVGMRFSGTAIPRGATIVNAYIQFQTDETQSVATSLTIQGEDTDNAGAFSSLTRNISSRPRTTAAVSWSPPTWATVGEAGPDQRTSDIASVIQEIVDRPGWSSDNAMVLIITGTGERVAESYDGNSAGAPLLHVEFTPGD
jgi:hypothetical protein